MLYNQPLDQPTNPNAPYIDGNPAAGIQGSIVPAASIEFDQREVVEVISRANSRGYTDFSDTPCASPANTDMMQLRKAIEGFIRSIPGPPSDLIDSIITYHVHGAGADFPDLITAIEYLSKYKITHNGFVVLQLAAGRFNYSQMVCFDHPQNHRIGVVGAPMLAAVPTAISAYAVNGSSTGQRATDTATNLAMLQTKFATELHFTGGSALEMDGHCLCFLDAILVTGDGSTGPVSDAQLISVAGTAGKKYGGNFTLGIAGGGIPPQGIHAGLAAVGGGYGFTAISGSATLSWGSGGGPLVAIGNVYSGFIGNARSGMFTNAVMSLGNGGSGFDCVAGSILSSTSLIAACNAGLGVDVGNNSYAISTGGQIWKNANYGLYCNQARANIVADFGDGSGNRNLGGAITASNGAVVNIGGSVNATVYTPSPFGTMGNNGSYIFFP